MKCTTLSPHRRPASYHAQSAITQALTARPRAGTKPSFRAATSAPAASKNRGPGSGKPIWCANVTTNRKEYPCLTRNWTIACISKSLRGRGGLPMSNRRLTGGRTRNAQCDPPWFTGRKGFRLTIKAFAALWRAERLQLVACGFAEVLHRIDPCPALHHFMHLAERPVRCEVGGDGCVHGLHRALDNSRGGQEAHPANHGVEGDELPKIRLVTQDGIAIGFRCHDDEIFVEVVSPRHFAGELRGPHLSMLAQPSRDARGQSADHRSAKRR